MRIVNSVLGDATGGRWQVVCDYNRVLRQQGFPVLMLLNKRHLPDLDRVPDGVSVALVNNRGHYDYPASWAARSQMRRFAPDVALAHCSRSVALLKRALKGIAPVAAVSHSNKVRRLLPADAYLPLTSHIRENIQLASGGAISKPCFVIPNMIAVNDADSLSERRLKQPVRIGALGRFDPVKGFDVFIDALGLIRSQGLPFQAVLGGEGQERQRLVDRARQLGLTEQLELPGWIDRTDQFLAGLDVLCVQARSDAFGLTPLQAAVAGVPMVLSRAPGHLEMLSDETEALFCDVGDSAATAGQLVRLINDAGLAEQLRQAAFQRVLKCYSEKVVTKTLLQALNQIYEIYNNYKYKYI
jgi:glycosyltransferase involved in cell wall biosynthesis